jgi:Protein of unknown function (DUF3237)
MGDPLRPTVPALDFLATLTVNVGAPIDLGPTPSGHRRIIPITGGTVEGNGLTGTVLPGGADFQILRNSTLTELEAKYAIETDEGERLYVENFGLRSGAREDIEKLVRGERVDPGRIYFRCAPKLTTASARLSWLNSRIFLGTGERHPDTVVVHVFTVN